MEKETANSNRVLLQSTTQTNQEMMCDNGNVNADLSTNVTADESLDTTDLEMPETYSQVSQQTETTHGSLGDTLIRAKQLQDGQVPEALQHSAATKVDGCDLDCDLEKAMDSVTKQVKKVDADCDKHGKHTSLVNVKTKGPSETEQRASMSTSTTAAVQDQQPRDAAMMPTLTVSSSPPRPLVMPTLAEDSVRRHYVSSKRQTTASRLTANSAVSSWQQQSYGNDVNNANSVQPEDLLVAVPVEDNEVHVYAVSHDVSQDKVHKQVKIVQARRHSCRLYFVVFLLVAASVTITLIVVIKRSKNGGQEQETEVTLLQNMTQLIVSIMGADAVLLNDVSSPYAKALTWLLQSNERNESQVMTNTLAQRFYAASFYFDTTTDVDKWTDCNPPNRLSDLNQTCYDSYIYNTSQAWLSDSHECEWAGVKCDNHQQIVRLGLVDMNLMGTIPSSTAKFPFLAYLWLSESGLEGNISLLSDCHHLVRIVVDNNLLSGDLSVVWQNRKLTGFSAVNNQFTGSLSSQIGNLVELDYLSLYGSELTGEVPSEVGWLDRIVTFDISNNHFRGKLPSTIQFWNTIENIFVGGNSLSGSIPTFLGQLNKTLQRLDLRDNMFTGTLPDELFHLNGLIGLDVSGNELSGTLDARFTQLTSSQRNTSIVGLYLSGNHFSGTIPTEFGLLTDLTNITLQDNDFTGNVPSSLCQNQYDLAFELSADCAKDDNEQVELQCVCCTECCQADGTQCRPN